jgi:hypothetical protein
MLEAVECQWYVAIDRPVCGDPPVGEVTHVVVKGKPKKLDEPLPVCVLHKARVDDMFARLRTAS